MRNINILSSFLLLLIGGVLFVIVGADESTTTGTSDVVVKLHDKNFDTAFPNQGLFVKFIAPW
jgi:hypothetical protein